MNERIIEFAQKAGLEDSAFPFKDWDNPELEKFAELIVRECIHIHKELSDASVVYDLGKGKELTPEQFILRCFGIQ